MDSADRQPKMFADYEPRTSSPDAAETARPKLPDALTILPATTDDIPSIARLLTRRDGCPSDVAVERAERMLAPDGEKLVLVARLGPDVCAFGRVGLVERAPPPFGHVPPGWYLLGVVVDPDHRRRGVGLELTRIRLAWIAQRAAHAYYFANSVNRATIDLHERLGFREVCRDFTFPKAHFSAGGTGVLFRVDF